MKRQVLSLGLAFGVMVAFGSIAGAAAAEPLKIAYGSPWIGWGPLYVAQEQGYFEEEGLEVEIAFIESSTPQEGFDLLASKQIDGRLVTLDEATLYWSPETPYAVMLATEKRRQ